VGLDLDQDGGLLSTADRTLLADPTIDHRPESTSVNMYILVGEDACITITSMATPTRLQQARATSGKRRIRSRMQSDGGVRRPIRTNPPSYSKPETKNHHTTKNQKPKTPKLKNPQPQNPNQKPKTTLAIDGV